MESAKRKLGSICDGEIEIWRLAPEDLEESLDVLQVAFLRHENVCKATEINLDLPNSVLARAELTELCRQTADDGLSLVAKHAPTNKIVAILFNKLQWLPQPGETPFFLVFNDKHCKSPNSKALMEFMITMDEKVDVFKKYDADCLLELTFVGTLPEFTGRKIARTLFKYGVELARDLSKGIGTEFLPKELRDKRPKIVTALFSSRFSQKAGDAIGFDIINRVPFTEYSFNGKTYAERIGPEHPDCTHVALRL